MLEPCKRLIKSPKIYWGDSGLACYLLGVTSSAELERSPFLGALFEGFVAGEILKSLANRGRQKELYYFRDQQGLEVDFLVPRPNSTLWLVEAKAEKTVRPSLAAPLLSLRRASPKRSERLIVVHRKSRSQLPTAAIAGGVDAGSSVLSSSTETILRTHFPSHSAGSPVPCPLTTRLIGGRVY